MAILTHEFAHLRRRDTLVGWILALCEAVYYFHPVFHLTKRRILFERERATDDWVLAAGSKRSVYADALIDAAEICRDFSAKLGPVGVVAESFTDLRQRLGAIATNLKPRARLSKVAFALLVVAGVMCVPGFVLTARMGADKEFTLTEEVVDEHGQPEEHEDAANYQHSSRVRYGRVADRSLPTSDASREFGIGRHRQGSRARFGFQLIEGKVVFDWSARNILVPKARSGAYEIMSAREPLIHWVPPFVEVSKADSS